MGKMTNALKESIGVVNSSEDLEQKSRINYRILVKSDQLIACLSLKWLTN